MYDYHIILILIVQDFQEGDTGAEKAAPVYIRHVYLYRESCGGEVVQMSRYGKYGDSYKYK